MSRRYGGTWITTLALAGAVWVLPGCGSETPSAKHATATATKTTAPVADELVGTWVGRLGPPPPGSSSEYAPGKLYTMKIHADGTTEVFGPGANLADPAVSKNRATRTRSRPAADTSRLATPSV